MTRIAVLLVAWPALIRPPVLQRRRTTADRIDTRSLVFWALAFVPRNAPRFNALAPQTPGAASAASCAVTDLIAAKL
jgi:hypothetical protein